MKKMIDNIRKYLPVVFLFVLLFFCIRYRKDLSVEKILRYTPKEPVKAALLMLVFYAVKSVSFVFPIADSAAGCRTSVFYRNCTSGELSGKSSYTGTSLLDGTFFRLFHGGESYFQISEAENSGGLPERKSSVYFFFYENAEFFARGCSESVSGCGEDPIWNIYAGRDAGNTSGSYPCHDIWSKYQESRITGILALRSTSCDDQCILDPDT